MTLGTRRDWWRLAAALAVLGSVTAILRWLGVSNASTVSTSYLMVVLLSVATSRLLVAVVTSLAAMLGLNFFFLPSVGTFTIADPHNLWRSSPFSLSAWWRAISRRSLTRGPRKPEPPRRARPALRSEPRRADDDRQPGGAGGAGEV